MAPVSNTTRVLRSNTSTTRTIAEPLLSGKPLVSFSAPSSSVAASEKVQIVRPGSKLPGLTPADLTLLHRKQKELSRTARSTLDTLPPGRLRLGNTLEASLIFAQEAAGSAVCLDPQGWILTCSHCICDDEDDYRADGKRHWLLFYTGLAVQTECRFWDSKRDLALLKVIAVETAEIIEPGLVPTFPFVQLASIMPPIGTSIICLGQPGADDLEFEKGRKTKYNLVEISEGELKGIVQNIDPQDNSNIGTLMHNSWTYWGHSGAPLLKVADGTLVGLHSSWDSETGMRHGIPLVAIQDFLQKHFPFAGRGGDSLPAIEV